jgi:hypothetical protein
MALLLEVILHHFQHICRKIKGHKAGLEIEYLFYIRFSSIPRLVEVAQMNCVFATVQKFGSNVSKNCGNSSLVKIYTYVSLRGYKNQMGCT